MPDHPAPGTAPAARRAVALAFIACPLVMFAAACSPMPAGGSGPAPVPGQPIAVWLTEPEGRSGHGFYARNDSDRIQRITAVTLRDCQNLREECGAHPVDVVLCPGDARRIFAAHGRAPGERTFFNWDFQARGYEPGEPVVGADCGTGEG